MRAAQKRKSERLLFNLQKMHLPSVRLVRRLAHLAQLQAFGRSLRTPQRAHTRADKNFETETRGAGEPTIPLYNYSTYPSTHL